MKIFEISDGQILVGQNKQENWDLLNTNQNYWWFHLESFSSPHVILTIVEPSKTEIFQAGLYCKEYSKYKNYKNIGIIYTQIKNVTKTDQVGEVITRKTLRIKI